MLPALEGLLHVLTHELGQVRVSDMGISSRVGRRIGLSTPIMRCGIAHSRVIATEKLRCRTRLDGRSGVKGGPSRPPSGTLISGLLTPRFPACQ